MYNKLALLDDVIYTSDRDLSGTTIASVVITGIVVVFIGLLILIALVWLYGKIFTAINAKAAEKQAAIKAEANAAAAESSAAAASEVPLPVIEDGIEEETAAVIAAAVAAYGAQTGKRLAVRSVKRSASSSHGRNAWSSAGLSEATRPF